MMNSKPGDLDSQQYPVVDLIKYICALLVVSIHIAPLTSYYDVVPFSNYINYGIRHCLARIAVPFFFAAAGFFLFRKIDFDKFDVSVTKNYVFKLLRLLGIWFILLFVGDRIALWYMSSLVAAVCILTLLLYKRVSLKKMLIVAGLLYIIGLFGDSYYGLLEALQSYKVVGYAIKAYDLIFITTRNGLFMGFPFLLLGGMIEKKKVSIKPVWTGLGFVLSMLLLLCEAFLVKKYGLPKDMNMYIMLVPAIFFLLVLAVNVPAGAGNRFRKLRNVSIIVYFSHMFVLQLIKWGWMAINRLFGVDLDNSLLNYLLTVIISTLLGLLIDWLSKKEKLSFLRYLYS